MTPFKPALSPTILSLIAFHHYPYPGQPHALTLCTITRLGTHGTMN